jgi:hypothetical protein
MPKGERKLMKTIRKIPALEPVYNTNITYVKELRAAGVVSTLEDAIIKNAAPSGFGR